MKTLLPAMLGSCCAIAGLVAMQACTVRDESASSDSSFAPGIDSALGSAVESVTADPVPEVTDTLRTPLRSNRSLPPVAGETARQEIIDTRDRDSVSDPMFVIGPDGKLRPIKK